MQPISKPGLSAFCIQILYNKQRFVSSKTEYSKKIKRLPTSKTVLY